MLDPIWERVALVGGSIVAASACAKGAWVLATVDTRTHLWFVPVSGDARPWYTAPHRLTCVRAYDDGRVFAVGAAAALVRYDGTWHADPMPAVRGARAVWSADGVYVLTEDDLLHFDGRWNRVDLAAAGLAGHWADGDGRDGNNVIVGTCGTHSCMARGRGTRWTRDGCGSWYLYKVRVASRAFALGGDGLWQLDGDSWVDHPTYSNPSRDISRFPISLDTLGDRPFAITLFSPFEPRGARLATFDGAWRTLPLPPGVRGASVIACRMPDGTILVGDDAGALWRTVDTSCGSSPAATP